MKITGHTYSVTIRSQLKNVSGSCHRLCGASAASPEFTQEHCVLPRPCASADSSYLNRPIVGPTPPKLPASWSSNLRHHRVVCGVSRRTLTILLYPRHSVKGISRNLRDFFVQADSPSPAALRRAARSIYNRYGLARRFSFSTFYLPHFLRDFRRFSRIFPEKSAHFRSVTILQVAFPVMLW